MDDVEALCERLVVIGRGKKLFDGTLSGLRQSIALERNLRIELTDPTSQFSAEPCTRMVSHDGALVTLAFNPTDVSAPDLISRIAKKNSIRDIIVENPAIEAVIGKLYGNLGL
jgi:ABC-2 type transport system ATP-binding protein